MTKRRSSKYFCVDSVGKVNNSSLALERREAGTLYVDTLDIGRPVASPTILRNEEVIATRNFLNRWLRAERRRIKQQNSNIMSD